MFAAGEFEVFQIAKWQCVKKTDVIEEMLGMIVALSPIKSEKEEEDSVGRCFSERLNVGSV